MQIARIWLSRHTRRRNVPQQQEPSFDNDCFPIFPPPPPAEINVQRAEYFVILRNRKFWAPKGVFEDTTLYSLYRLYEYLVVDHVIGYRNQIEYFWKQRTWSVHDIPDPEDDNPARYAFLACIPHLLVNAFNRNIKLGLPRDAPAIMSPEQAEEFKARPESMRVYETVPEWTNRVRPLSETLFMRTHDDIVLDGPDDERADIHFKEKNIIMWTPHTFFI